MAKVTPFKALRFTRNAGDIDKVVCPPYDIISEPQRQAYLRENSNNVIRLELPRDGDDPYLTAKETLFKMLSSGVLKTDDRPAIYVYEIGFTAKNKRNKIRGIIARVELSEFSKGIVLPHEETLSKAKADRFELMKATFCNFSQIYSLYSDEDRITDKLVDEKTANIKPVNEFTDKDGLVHRLWIIDNEADCAEICKGFDDRKLYIADGHHRYETAINFRNYCRDNGICAPDADKCMMMLVSMQNEGLVVLPTHRIVRNLQSFDLQKIVCECERYFDIRVINENDVEKQLDIQYENGEKSFVLYADKTYRLLTLKDSGIMNELLGSSSDAYKGLDVNVLHLLILEKLFSIDKENMANQKNLTYTRHICEAVHAVDSGDADCAFLLNPTKVEEIRDVAAAGEKMPQKSTYFYPKLITGLVMNLFAPEK